MFRLWFDTTNDAITIGGKAEVSRILKSVSEAVWGGSLEGLIIDENGNSIGSWRWKDVEDK